ncbi:MAG: hypothetical protein M1829_006593 [Trizodia sp. TS-e1964]|nr:MAG: hypothetical protein M1829_006593 [Trizodia sp. TS-e1964]
MIYGIRKLNKNYSRSAFLDRQTYVEGQTLYELDEAPIRALDKRTGAPTSHSPADALQAEQARVFGGELTDADLVRLGLLEHTQDPPNAISTHAPSTACAPSVSLASLPSPLPTFRTRSARARRAAKAPRRVSFVDMPSPLRTTTTLTPDSTSSDEDKDDDEYDILSTSVVSLAESEAWEVLGEDLKQ